MLRWMPPLIFFLMLTACHPVQNPPEMPTTEPVEIPRAVDFVPTTATATTVPLPTDTPTPEASIDPYHYTVTAAASTRVALASNKPVVMRMNGLVISDTALLPAEPYRLRPGDQDDNFTFYLLLPQAMQGLPENLISTPAPGEAEAVLARFGYRLEQVDQVYWRLLQGETLLTDRVTQGNGPFPGPFQVNRSGKDFWMLLSVEGYQSWLLRKDSFELWYEGQPHPNPVFVGDDFFTAQVGMDAQGEEEEVHVKRNGETVFSYSGPEFWTCMEKLPTAPFNPRGGEQMATFFAREEGLWHFVKLIPEEDVCQ